MHGLVTAMRVLGNAGAQVLFGWMYSITEYLITTDPGRFDRLVLQIREGDDRTVALEKAYGHKLAELRANWEKWLATAK